MSVLAERTPGDVAQRAAPGWRQRLPAARSAFWPTVVGLLNGLAFYLVRPNVGDLQAALARQAAAASGVGLTYWFDWFGGGAAPGSYSVITPAFSSVIGAPLVGALGAAVVAPLAARALTGTRYPALGVWVAAFTAGMNLWAGRIPFALGAAVALVGLILFRERRPWWWAAAAAVVSCLCSPVTGAFLAFAAATTGLADRSYRRAAVWLCVVTAVAFVLIAVVFGSPGSQPFSIGAGLLTAASALAMLAARPPSVVRTALWWTAIGAVLLALVPNGMGSNFERLPWLCLPVAVVATATARRWVVALAVLPALVLCGNATIVDLVRSEAPSASAAYYTPLIHQLDALPDLQNYRLEVVTDPAIHTAAFALLGHAALAGGYETQEQNEYNSILDDPQHLDATTYQIWLQNNAVGYVAFNRHVDTDSAEYQLLQHTRLPYLKQVNQTDEWRLYRVVDPTPIVPRPARLLRATQAQLRVSVPCTCRVPLRIRYSKFLHAVALPASADLTDATVVDDGYGWTTLITHHPGRYVLGGDLIQPLH